MNLKYFTMGLRVTGRVRELDSTKGMFSILARSGDIYEGYITGDTYFYMVKNSDKIDRDRTDFTIDDKLKRYLSEGQLVSAYGIVLMHDGVVRYDVKSVALFGKNATDYDFEEGHWWLTQITSFADVWLKRQFGNDDTFDFTQYRTNLTAAGTPSENSVQECDTITRLLYGLSSAYMLTGNQRYLSAVKSGVKYQREMFKTTSNDGQFVVWHHALKNGEKILSSQFNEDINSIPLYEQIYALAGLAQYYKATGDWEALEDIRRTVNFFEIYYRDKEKKGYFSHIDPVDFSYSTPWLKNDRAQNFLRKNWNSIGDHTPAFMLNVMLAIEGIPDFENEYNYFKDIQMEMAELICEHFHQNDSRYIKERFHVDWVYDDKYSWQQDRTVIGHNLKIAWNLTRLYHLFKEEKYLITAELIADKIVEGGLDMVRGGWYDVVERNPKNGMFIDFPWHNRKAWWQQEQGILAYLILAGSTKSSDKRERYLDIARESIAFWNLAFLDQDYGETYFDVLENGYPYVVEDRAQSASHSKSGYHSMELNYLAHIYYRLLILKKDLRLHYSLSPRSNIRYFNLMPDFLPKENFRVSSLSINGTPYNDIDQDRLQVRLKEDYVGKEADIILHIGMKNNKKK